MRRRALIISVLILLFPLAVYSSPITTEISYRYGEKTTEEELVNSRDNLDYSYNKYKFLLKGVISPQLDFNLGYIDYNRQYEELAGYDNRIRNTNLRVNYTPKDTPVFLIKNYFNYCYRDKYYTREVESLDFVQNRFNAGTSYLLKDVWKGSVSVGINKYNFPNAGARDRDKYYGRLRLEKYFDEKNTILWGRSKIQYTDFPEKDTMGETVNAGGVKIKFPTSIISGISIKGELGERSTVEGSEEDDLDYSYWEQELNMYHDLNERVKLKSFGSREEKEYTGAKYDSTAHSFGVDARFYILKSAKKRLYLISGWNYIEREYQFLANSSYNKHTLKGGIKYIFWRDWSLVLVLTGSDYNYYEKRDKDKNVYSLELDFSKYVFNNKGRLNLGYKYQYKDNLAKSDLRQNSFEAGFRLNW